MSKDRRNTIKLRGKVSNVGQGGRFKVLLENGVEINATMSGKLRVYKIQILKGDTVEVELSPYDLTQGRITYRAS